MNKVICPEPIKKEEWSTRGDFKAFKIRDETVTTLKKINIQYLFPI